MNKWVCRLGILISVLGLAWAGYHVYLSEKNYAQIDTAYQDIASVVTVQTAQEPEETDLPEQTTAPVEAVDASDVGTVIVIEDEPASQPAETEVSEYAPVRIDYNLALQLYPNMCAWLYSEGTQINYPVMQCSDNSYYLNHLPDGQESVGGSLFVDCGFAADFSGKNTVIYGHNMQSGSMFGSLRNYKDGAYYAYHPTLFLTTPAGEFRLDVLAGFDADTEDNLYNALNEWDDLSAYLQACIDRSEFKTDASATAYERSVVLSTCTTTADKRFVLVCGLVPLNS